MIVLQPPKPAECEAMLEQFTGLLNRLNNYKHRLEAAGYKVRFERMGKGKSGDLAMSWDPPNGSQNRYE